MVGNQDKDALAGLEKLAVELGTRGYQTRVEAPPDRVVSLVVVNPQTRNLTEYIAASDGSFWWSWAERIAPWTDVGGAAQAIDRVLGSGTSSA